MSDASSGNPLPAPAPMAADEANLRSMALLCYGLLFAAFVFGVTAVAAVILAYIKRGDAAGTVWQSHYRNVIVVFWVLFTALLIGTLAWPIAFGVFAARDFAWPYVSVFSAPFTFWMIGLPIVVIWSLYRAIRGFIHATEGRPY